MVIKAMRVANMDRETAIEILGSTQAIQVGLYIFMASITPLIVAGLLIALHLLVEPTSGLPVRIWASAGCLLLATLSLWTSPPIVSAPILAISILTVFFYWLSTLLLWRSVETSNRGLHVTEIISRQHEDARKLRPEIEKQKERLEGRRTEVAGLLGDLQATTNAVDNDQLSKLRAEFEEFKKGDADIRRLEKSITETEEGIERGLRKMHRYYRNMRVAMSTGAAISLLFAISQIWSRELWLQSERLTTEKSTIVGYHLKSSDAWSTLLTEKDRKIVHIERSSIKSRTTCSLDVSPKPVWLKPIGSRSNRYPKC